MGSLWIPERTLYVYDQSSNHIFGGLVTLRQTTNEGLLATYSITATDWGYKMDSKLVVKSYAAMDPADIVNDLITNFAASGFTQNHVNRGNFLVNTIRFNYMPVTKAIEKLAAGNF